MDTEKKFGLKKSKALLLFLQMILIIIILTASIYLLVFVSINKLGFLMILTYIFITLSILSIIIYSVIGYKKKSIYYRLSVLPFLVAIFINILLPNREIFQIVLLALLFIVTSLFILRQQDQKFTYIVSLVMVVISLVFSIYSSIKANTQFLGELSASIFAYIAMYLSIFVPTIMSGTFALTYNIRTTR